MKTANDLRPEIGEAIHSAAMSRFEGGGAATEGLAKFRVLAEMDHGIRDDLLESVREARAAGRTWKQIAEHSDGSNSGALARRASKLARKQQSVLSDSRLEPLDNTVQEAAATLANEGVAPFLDLAVVQVLAEIEHVVLAQLSNLADELRAAGMTWATLAAHSDGKSASVLQNRLSKHKRSRSSAVVKVTPGGERAYTLTEAHQLTGKSRTNIRAHIEQERELRGSANDLPLTWWIDLPVGQTQVPHVLDLDWIRRNIRTRQRPAKNAVEKS
jgi:hypothetical protein